MYRIGELATACEVTADTLRFYEKNGLLSPSSRSDKGYRLYTDEDARHLKFILRAKAMGFSLTEISELLNIEASRSDWACADVKGMVEAKAAELQRKIDEMTRLRDSLQELADACCGGPESAIHCSILDTLETK
ncbi:Zn(2+)-responsive transcriptional regulator [Ferrimonas sediminicola]|uniref:Zn(2+)-responsive transcriptional regulator n=1 Tax=Ferrimonas sediminicola TaxID=2569538 RepID=A0A4U1BIV4_9GAMM|nr:Zn(2+)-responsive transcriptional regulator [Ferrimonas sediminicola]TKB51319.1 Zn(2+)-responsive transcriptional regulator [Ferrimonas sediminicola]